MFCECVAISYHPIGTKSICYVLWCVHIIMVHFKTFIIQSTLSISFEEKTLTYLMRFLSSVISSFHLLYLSPPRVHICFQISTSALIEMSFLSPNESFLLFKNSFVVTFYSYKIAKKDNLVHSCKSFQCKHRIFSGSCKHVYLSPLHCIY